MDDVAVASEIKELQTEISDVKENISATIIEIAQAKAVLKDCEDAVIVSTDDVAFRRT